MSAPPPIPTTPRRSDWLSRFWLVPSWLISLSLHAGAVALLIVWSQHWQPAPVGFADEPAREIGIVLKDSPGTALEVTEAPPQDAVDPAPPSEPATPTTVAAPTSVQPATPQPTTAAVLPQPALPVIGGGLTRPSTAVADPRDLIKGGGGQTAAARLDAAVPGAAFMGVRDQGTRVVFVVDSSGSMANHGAMQSAKAALVASLQTLTDAQQFQIVFYNNTPTVMRLRNNAPAEMAFATEVNKTLARQFIVGVQPDQGTDHLPALKLALRLNPDVLFFLTDADEPQLSAGELLEIQRLNQGRTRIHTIEFGRGADLGGPLNFLQKLAHQNGGTHRYYDVQRLAKER
jgi:hypothetical protein